MKSSIKGGNLTKKQFPNIITISRMVFSAAILFCPVFSPAFWVFYIAAGLSDMLDGAAARKFNAVSKTGERLDTAADIVFVAVCLIKLLPAVELPLWLLVWTGVIALIKVINVISGCVIRKEFVALHTAANKLTGALLFALPLTIGLLPLSFTGGIVCAAATFAAIQEGHFIRETLIKGSAVDSAPRG